jgi:hypothetical protein
MSRSRGEHCPALLLADGWVYGKSKLCHQLYAMKCATNKAQTKYAATKQTPRRIPRSSVSLVISCTPRLRQPEYRQQERGKGQY